MYDMISKPCLHILWFQVGELFTPDHRTLGSCLAQLVRCLLIYLSTPYKINITPSTQISMTKSSSLQKCHSIPCCQNDSYSSSGNLLDKYRYLNSSWLAIASRCSHKRLERLLLRLHEGCLIVPRLFNTKNCTEGIFKIGKKLFSLQY